MVAVGVIGIAGLALYAGFSIGFSIVTMARENLRATQILVQRTETIRLYKWTQLTNTTDYLKPTFTELYDPLGKTNQTSGAVYVGTVSVTIPNDLPDAYRDNMRTITVTVYWTNHIGGKTIPRSRQMQTYAARFGMQPYVLSTK